jgi:uncharacterized protein
VEGPVSTRAQALDRIADHRGELAAMGITSVQLFGSIARDHLTPESDIDILIEFDRPIGAFQFLDIQAYLEDVLGRRVDLVTPRAIKPRMRERILAEAVRAA